MANIKAKRVTIGAEATEIVNLTDATAQESDVAVGKTYYGADGNKKAGSDEANESTLGVLTVTENKEYDASSYDGIGGWSHVSAQVTPKLQPKQITLKTSTSIPQIVKPDSGNDGLSEVKVYISSTSETAFPSDSLQTITGAGEKWLRQVEVKPVVPESTPTFEPKTTDETYSAGANKWYKTVKVKAISTETKSETPGAEPIEVKPTPGKWLSKVTIDPVPTETRTVSPAETAYPVTASEGKWFKTITIDKINIAATPTVTENKTLTAPSGQYYKEVIINVPTGGSGEPGGTNTSDATATAADILAGTTAYIASGKVEGTIPKYDRTFTGGVEITTTTVSDGKPIELDTADKMDSALASANYGQVFRYVGYDCQYENGALYRVSGVKSV